jgi:hypothetical protein
MPWAVKWCEWSFLWKFLDCNTEDSTVFSVFWQIFHKLFGIKFCIFSWMFVRFTPVGKKFSLPLFLTSRSLHPKEVLLKISRLRPFYTFSSFICFFSILEEKLQFSLSKIMLFFQNGRGFLCDIERPRWPSAVSWRSSVFCRLLRSLLLHWVWNLTNTMNSNQIVPYQLKIMAIWRIRIRVFTTILNWIWI